MYMFEKYYLIKLITLFLQFLWINGILPQKLYDDLRIIKQGDSTLNKKSQIIAYHFVGEGVARDGWRTAYVSTYDNTMDLLTKGLPMGDKGGDSSGCSSIISLALPLQRPKYHM